MIHGSGANCARSSLPHRQLRPDLLGHTGTSADYNFTILFKPIVPLARNCIPISGLSHPFLGFKHQISV
jgi:hypothetical protein